MLKRVERACGQLDLRSGFDGDGFSAPRYTQKVAFAVYGFFGVAFGKLRKQPGNAMLLAVRHGRVVVAYNNLLKLYAKLSVASMRFDAAFEKADQCIDIALSCRLRHGTMLGFVARLAGCSIHETSSLAGNIAAIIRHFGYNKPSVGSLCR